MSAIAEWAPPARAAPARHAADGAPTAFAAAAFFALAAFASVVYGELLLHPPALRALAVAAIASAGTSTLALRRPGGRPVLPLAARPAILALTLLLALLAAGIPLSLFAPARWGVLSHRVGHGVDELGGWLWPYRGTADWARLDVLAVVPVVLVVAGGLRFWPGAGPGRRGVSLALLIGLFLAGAANISQTDPGLRGLVLLVLVAAWLWAPAAEPGSAARAGRWLLLPAVLALALRPGLSSTSAWVAFREAPGGEDGSGAFQWDQSYGPISWPRGETTMFTVIAAHPGLLRVTSLDRFDGLRFLRSASPPETSRVEAAPPLRRRFLTRTVVTIAGLHSDLLVSDGVPQRLRWLGGREPAVAAEGDGTLVASSLAEGSVYSVVGYQPSPSPARMRSAPRAFPRAYMPYVSFELPGPHASALEPPRFAAEAALPAPASLTIEPSAPSRTIADEPAKAARVASSPYGPMFRLAQRLAAGASSPYDVAANIERYLLANYTYYEHPAQARYPLEAFLFRQRRGYCQQFSGAMTLMLRMDGIPARVGSGFKPTLYDRATGTWTIRAADAHSWVEVFFTGIGWVSFDPTPPAPAPVAAGAAGAADKDEIDGAGAARSGPAAVPLGASAPRAPNAHGVPAGTLGVAAALVLLTAALAAAWLRGHLRLRRGLRGGEAPVRELAWALARSAGGHATVTLDRLERQMRERGEEQAAGYLAVLRDRRYAREAAPAGARGRAALRRALMRGAGRRAWLGLLAGMPPGAMRRRPGAEADRGAARAGGGSEG